MPIETMPSGLEFEFREMKTSDEDVIAEARESGSPRDREVVMERILRTCWVKTHSHGPYANRLTEGKIDMMDLLLGDVSYYMWRLYRESRGDTMPIRVPCHEGHLEWSELDLSKLEVYRLSKESQRKMLASESYEFTLPRTQRKVTFGLMSWKMQKALEDTMASFPKQQVTYLMATRVITVEGFDEQGLDPETSQDKVAFIAELPTFDRNALSDEILSVECGVESLVDLRCPKFGCGRVVSIELEEKGGVDFFASRRHLRRSSRK